MYTCDLCFADIHFHMESEFQIVINKESEPFVVRNQDGYDILIRFIPRNRIDFFPGDSEWIEDKLYTLIDDQTVTYVKNLQDQPPYVMIRYADKQIEISYLPEAEKNITHTHDILNIIGLEKILLERSTFMLHSSLISYMNRAILFSAPCGVGKSTQADLWSQFRNSETLNGDRAGLRFMNEKWQAYGMPFAGTSGIYKNESVPIAAIVTLEQNKENKIRRLTPMEAIRRLLPECSCRRWDSEFVNQLLNLLILLTSQIPVYLLQCRPDEGAVDILYNTLLQEEVL